MAYPQNPNVGDTYTAPDGKKVKCIAVKGSIGIWEPIIDINVPTQTDQLTEVTDKHYVTDVEKQALANIPSNLPDDHDWIKINNNIVIYPIRGTSLPTTGSFDGHEFILQNSTDPDIPDGNYIWDQEQALWVSA